MNQLQEAEKHLLDAAAIGAWIGALAGWLPVIAAALSIVWTVIRILETRTVQRWLRRQ
jgi:TctA family transporter